MYNQKNKDKIYEVCSQQERQEVENYLDFMKQINLPVPTGELVRQGNQKCHVLVNGD